MKGGISFNPAKDIPSLEGKVILITGATMGLGKQSALDLSNHNPSQIWIAARNAGKASEAISEIKRAAPGVQVQFLKLDLASFDSIKDASRRFSTACSRLDILMLNAGIMGGPAATTEQGYEIRFGINHVGHALLVKLLLPLLSKAAADPIGIEPRIVSISSAGHRHSTSAGIEFDTLKSKQDNLSTVVKYGQSKMANVVYARELAKRYPEFTTVSVYPGTVKTELFSAPEGGLLYRLVGAVLIPLTAVSVEEGVKTQLWAATAKGIKTGEYYEPIGVTGKDNARSKDGTFVKELWDWTQRELEGHDI